MAIKWSDIEKEVGPIRKRMVEVYLKYQGEETDEIVRGKPIKVTAESFAKHMGIAPRTFRNWLGQYGPATPNSPADLPPEGEKCVNEKVPPRKGFVLEAADRLREGLEAMPKLSEDTHRIILEDIEVIERLIAEIKSNLKVGNN